MTYLQRASRWTHRASLLFPHFRLRENRRRLDGVLNDDRSLRRSHRANWWNRIKRSNEESTEIPKLEDDAPTAQWGNARDLIFGTDASLVMTTRAIKAIFEFPPQSWEISEKPLFYKQKSKSISLIKVVRIYQPILYGPKNCQAFPIINTLYITTTQISSLSM